jgi:Fur family transcriptional regulator, ferric uptake regulator
LRKEVEILRNFVKRRNLKWTSQREDILNAFLDMPSHVHYSAIQEELERRGKKVGYITIYRTMKLLCECCLAEERDFGDGYVVFDHPHDTGHHDHLICNKCGEIVEFLSDDVKQLMDELSRLHGFRSTHYRLHIYGLCRKCQRNEVPAAAG